MYVYVCVCVCDKCGELVAWGPGCVIMSTCFMIDTNFALSAAASGWSQVG